MWDDTGECVWLNSERNFGNLVLRYVTETRENAVYSSEASNVSELPLLVLTFPVKYALLLTARVL